MSAEGIEFRHAAPQEVGAMALVLARANAQRDGSPLPVGIGDSQVLEMQERMDRANVWTYVAADGEEIAGFALGHPRTEEEQPATDTDTEHLSFLMIEPDYWGRHIASRLLDLVADRARIAGRSRLTLWTRHEDNTHARNVYEHKGFALTRLTRDSPYGQQVHYQLDL